MQKVMFGAVVLTWAAIVSVIGIVGALSVVVGFVSIVIAAELIGLS